jgi:uncharacterized protein (DUF2141 family)
MDLYRLLVLVIGSAVSLSVCAASVAVTIQGVTTEDGVLYVQLCSKEEFMVKRCSFQARAAAKRGDMTMTFADVPDGDWAASAFLDENKNGRLDKNFLGIPTEPWGFSRNAKARFGPPAYGDAQVNIKGDTSIVFRLTN